MMDIYFEENYGKLYEEYEQGKCVNFKYKDTNGEVKYIFIKRKIIGQKYFDITTPYGYGGPLIRLNKDGNKEELLKAYQESFTEYCIENNIVSEFVRFHPLVNNADDFKNFYIIKYERNTVATNLIDSEDPFLEEFSKSTRKTIRRLLKGGLEYRVIKSPESIEEFIKIYYSTMSRNDASEYYYFDEKYFNNCLKYFKKNIVLVEIMYNEEIICSSINFIYNEFLHVHLSGTLSEYINLSPAYILKYATLEWAQNNNIQYIHYGGGKTNDKNDSLYKFKKKFTESTEFHFYTGCKIWDCKVYDELCKKNGVDSGINYFPAYRYNM